jgi:hypothetical protein
MITGGDKNVKRFYDPFQNLAENNLRLEIYSKNRWAG